MTANEFIFSNQKKHRLTRHLVFWGIYTLYFYPQSIWYPDRLEQLLNWQVYYDALLNFACFIPACIFAVYVSIYILLPAFLQRKRYTEFIMLFIALFLACVGLNYFFSYLYYQLVSDPEANTTFIGLLNLSYINSTAAIIISGIALGIKVTKNLQQQQKENLAIAQKKARIDLQLQKARIHPEFLFRTLNSINNRILSKTPDASEMILRLSDLLSYTLYSGKDKAVPLDQELAALQDFVYLEHRKQDGHVDISTQITGKHNGKYIGPMIILWMLNESISVLTNCEPEFGSLKLSITTSQRWISVTVSLRTDETQLTEAAVEMLAQNIRRRFSLSFAGNSYRIETRNSTEEDAVFVQLRLRNGLSKVRAKSELKENHKRYEPV